MERQTLFGHLATQFSNSSEDLATESLNFILENKKAKELFLRFIEQMGVKLTTEVGFKTQSRQKDHSRPDLVGIDSTGNNVIIVESKFWAGLTDMQPVNYIDSLPDNEIGILLFIAPKIRLPTLWPEIIIRLKENGIDFTNPIMKEIWGKSYLGRINEYHSIAITSWRSLLDYIISGLESEGLREVAADAMQLRGLTESQDTDAFLPIKSEELHPQFPGEFFNILNSLTKCLRN
jgi:hypothetical protein